MGTPQALRFFFFHARPDLAAVLAAFFTDVPRHPHFTSRRAMATMASLSFASVRGALTRRGGFAARTSSAVRPYARGVAAASGAPDVPADAYLVTYCHVRAQPVSVARADDVTRAPSLAPRAVS